MVDAPGPVLGDDALDRVAPLLADEEAPAALKAVVPPEPPADAAHRS